MIVRSSEAVIKPDRREEFMQVLTDLVATFPDRYPGLRSHAILIDRADPNRVTYQSAWLDADALRGFAGDGWATDPVTFAGEDELLAEPLRLRHFDLLEADPVPEDYVPEE